MEHLNELENATKNISEASRVSIPKKGLRPRYEETRSGLPNYWHPVSFLSTLGSKPKRMTLLGQKLALYKQANDEVYAIADECPHRGVPLSLGKCEWVGTITCPYHGFVFDLKNGDCVAALTDGPDSPIVGKIGVRTYPVQVKKGIVWVYVGDKKAVEVAEDIPEEFLRDDTMIKGRFTVREGNWRYAAENGFDEGHFKYLHRRSLWMLFRHLPAWSTVKIKSTEDGKWIYRDQEKIVLQDEYPGLGVWAKKPFWKRMNSYAVKRFQNNLIDSPVVRSMPAMSIRLPGMLRIKQSPKWVHYEWYVPVDDKHHLYAQFAVTWTPSIVERAWFSLKYKLWINWAFHKLFNDQDARMVELMPESFPERMYRPDVSITSWRRLVINSPRNGNEAEI